MTIAIRLACLAALVAGCGGDSVPGASADFASPATDFAVAPAPDLTQPTCSDKAKNGAETDVDCGGAMCPKCGDTKACAVAGDCADGVCAQGRCAAPSCSDGIKNGGESDADCGGSCTPCGVGRMCNLGVDCSSKVCLNGGCVAPSCSDSTLNGNESDVDCGGSCPPCSDGSTCRAALDCKSGVCTSTMCVPASCADGVKNGGETDVDCGGPQCAPCPTGCHDCIVGADCQSGVCMGQCCLAPTCSDGVKNGNETDVDCGGACPHCAPGKACKGAGDCASGVCLGGICAAPTCSDGIKNGAETDVDCGGPCPTKCATGKTCSGGGDCLSGVCAAGTCSAAGCTDGVKNGVETDVDCGGASCPKCVAGKSCGGAGDCSGTATCSGGTCACQAGYSGPMCAAATSCLQIHALSPTAGDGVYTILLNASPTSVYCDMTTDSGGWTLVGYASFAGPNQSCAATSAHNLYSLATGGGTYDATGRTGTASLAAAPLARASTYILLGRSDTNGYAGNIAGMTVATKFALPSPSTVNFLDSNANSTDPKGTCTPVSLVTVVGPNVTGQTRYTYSNTLSTTWGDTYPTSYGADNAPDCTTVGSPVGPSFVSAYTGVGRSQGPYCWPFDSNGGAYTYWFVGWWDPTANSKGGAASIWLR